jgi:hypothetical protein
LEDFTRKVDTLQFYTLRQNDHIKKVHDKTLRCHTGGAARYLAAINPRELAYRNARSSSEE